MTKLKKIGLAKSLAFLLLAGCGGGEGEQPIPENVQYLEAITKRLERKKYTLTTESKDLDTIYTSEAKPLLDYHDTGDGNNSYGIPSSLSNDFIQALTQGYREDGVQLNETSVKSLFDRLINENTADEELDHTESDGRYSIRINEDIVNTDFPILGFLDLTQYTEVGIAYKIGAIEIEEKYVVPKTAGLKNTIAGLLTEIYQSNESLGNINYNDITGRQETNNKDLQTLFEENA